MEDLTIENPPNIELDDEDIISLSLDDVLVDRQLEKESKIIVEEVIKENNKKEEEVVITKKNNVRKRELK